jgi:hypothetical protein
MFGSDIGVELLHSCHMYIERWWFEYDGRHGSNRNFIKVDKTLLVLEISQRRPVYTRTCQTIIRDRQMNIDVLGIYSKVDANDDELDDKAMCE